MSKVLLLNVYNKLLDPNLAPIYVHNHVQLTPLNNDPLQHLNEYNNKNLDTLLHLHLQIIQDLRRILPYVHNLLSQLLWVVQDHNNYTLHQFFWYYLPFLQIVPPLRILSYAPKLLLETSCMHIYKNYQLLDFLYCLYYLKMLYEFLFLLLLNNVSQLKKWMDNNSNND